MKGLLFTALLLSFSAQAHEPVFDKKGMAMQAIYLSLHAVDYEQSLVIANTPGLRESNPILGYSPSQRQVHAWFLTSAVMHTYVSATLHGRSRHVWQVMTSAVEFAYVHRNYELGVRFSF